MQAKIKGILKTNYDLSHLTWFKVGGKAEFFFKPLDLEDLTNFLINNQKPINIIGAGSNSLIRDGGIKDVVIKLGQNFTNIELNDNGHLSVGAACLNFNLAQFCIKNSITGFEFLVGIPGTIGGGIIMNAGAYNHEFKDIVLEIEALTYDGKLSKFKNHEIGFKYRGNSLSDNLIITKVTFKTSKAEQNSISALMNEISKKRLETQPVKTLTSGSTFANPYPHKAWQLIDEAGLRGYRLGGASISELHCNFMINHGNATANDLENLGEFVRNEVFKKSGIMLEWEIKRIGFKD